MAEHNDHGFMATKENAAPLKQATIDRALAMNEKSVSLPRGLKQDAGAAQSWPRREAPRPILRAACVAFFRAILA